MITHEQLAQLLEACQYPGWKICLGFDGDQPLLQVRCDEGRCNVTGAPLAWGGRKWRLSWHMTASEVVQTAFLAVLSAVEHETRERFTYRGVAVFQPHRDLDRVVEMAQTTSERT